MSIRFGSAKSKSSNACEDEGQRGFPGTFFTATGLVHQLMEAPDERRLIKVPKNAVEYRPVIYTRHAARLNRLQRPNGGV